MADVADLLQALHPMREPSPLAPLAPYLEMLGLGVAAAAVGYVVFRQLARRKAGLQRAAEAALAASRHLTPAARLAAQADMLRRLVRARSGDTAARTVGSAWLGALDHAFATTYFTQGDGRAFADALYRREPVADVEAIDSALVGLLRAKPPAQPLGEVRA